MKALHVFFIAAAVLASGACGFLAAQDEPAVIAPATQQSRAELARVVSSALNGQRVTLADDALTRDSVLTIERGTPPGAQGRAATGRTIEEPERFTLVLRNSRCVLVRAADGRAFPLDEARCVPAGSGR
jgi:outer membrane lipopolysaccharide assembly protein LptE/RlpB